MHPIEVLENLVKERLTGITTNITQPFDSRPEIWALDVRAGNKSARVNWLPPDRFDVIDAKTGVLTQTCEGSLEPRDSPLVRTLVRMLACLR